MTLSLYHPLQAWQGNTNYLFNQFKIFFFQGHYHEEVKSGVIQNHKFYQGLEKHKFKPFLLIFFSKVTQGNQR